MQKLAPNPLKPIRPSKLTRPKPLHEISGLEIPEERHGKGRDINVRIVQVDSKRWDLDEPDIVDGSITIRYRSNNFPMYPRIPLRVYVSGRG